MTLLVMTGATGFLGTAFCRAALQRMPEVRIRALVRDANRARWLPDAVECLPSDLADPECLQSALCGADAVVHMAALVDSTDTQALHQTNVVTTRTLAEAARNRGVGKFVLLSSGGVYGRPDLAPPRTEETPPRPDTPYGRSKLEAERVARQFLEEHAKLSILRPTGMYGPGRKLYARLLRAMRKRPLAMSLTGDEIVHPCHSEDIVNAIISVVTRPRHGTQVYNVAGERALPLRQMHDRLAALAGISRIHVTLPPWVGVPLVRMWIRLNRRPDAERELILAKARGLSPGSQMDTARIQSHYKLDWKPLDQGLREMVASFRES